MTSSGPGPAGLGSVAALASALGVRGLALKAAIDDAEARGDHAAGAERWLELGDALAAMERADRAVVAWERGVAQAELARAAGRRSLSSLAWRLGQVFEAQAAYAPAGESPRLLGLADGWYERAADAFAADGDAADEATARMALARVRYHHQGGGLARGSAREAARLAKASDDDLLYAEAMELSATIAFDVGDFEEMASAAREAARHYRKAHDGQGEVRATIALAEALVETEQVAAAVSALAPIEAQLESVEHPETRGRGLALMTRFHMAVGQIDDATKALERAQAYFVEAGARLRAARLLMAVGRTIEQRVREPGAALGVYRQAWEHVKHERDRFRLAPIVYSLARVLHQTGDAIQADGLIEQAIAWTQEAADVEGLAHCVELGVRIAVKLGQGQIALDRMILLARTRARLGDSGGELRTLLLALDAALKVPGLDPTALAEEFMEAVRRTGLAFLGPDEAQAVARRLADAERPAVAAELALIDGQIQESAGKLQKAARAFATASRYALGAGERDDALTHLERAIALGEPLLLPELEDWRADRQLLVEGGG
ncbi:MAG: hypothetical protein IT385_12850 [Deltaproteobacteria bacterium]|nr:hypothetical protein [Deltaproteobacteria bacterium]